VVGLLLVFGLRNFFSMVYDVADRLGGSEHFLLCMANAFEQCVVFLFRRVVTCHQSMWEMI
jgi:hypothetical protein